MRGEKFLKPAVGLGLALSLGFTASAGAAESKKPAGAHHEHKVNKRSGFVANDTYYSDGVRVTRFQDDSASYQPASTIAYCDSNDLVEVTRTYTPNRDTIYGGFKQRTPDYPACDDGRLTPSDFPDKG